LVAAVAQTLGSQFVVTEGDLPDPLRRIASDLSDLPGELSQRKQPHDLVVGTQNGVASLAVAILQLFGRQMLFEE
jgi:hypothetical protein